VIRQTSNHEETISKTENRATVMSTVEMFSPDIAAQYGRKMVEIESRGNGDQMSALERVGRECGLGARALRRIINGETIPTLPVFIRMRAGYLNICERQIRKLEMLIETEKARFGHEPLEGIGAEVQALAAKIEAAKRAR
jgi:hypothetical protein